MTYSTGHPIKLVGGRLALDFVNTADWTSDGQVCHEKIATTADLEAWLKALEIPVRPVACDVDTLLAFRAEMRDLLLGQGDATVLNAVRDIRIADDFRHPKGGANQPLIPLLAVSALSILMDDREWRRLKICPGERCGWLFIDETKNARRTWCSMQTCGNRAKAARHYARSKAVRDQSGLTSRGDSSTLRQD
ncbi:CGNR zinc finger domain-containing protein [Thalassococcus sp. S3]|uniref:CGNR zinc finger domain-containing protein n=1 Tax=Thalassococcus sp. S3 TaxID=2017482 RepID=UPI001024934C|nr:CGNR zinc finger domain-containing protein [Thalassococcus sp. S3]QBF32487.1 hypothetical protein CFI11_14865 [Thalassococcus sp. S3]